MLAISKIQIINKSIPTKYVKIFSQADMFGNCKVSEEKVPNYLVGISDLVGVLNRTVYCYGKSGYLYTCITINGFVFSCDSSDIIVCEEPLITRMRYSNYTPRFIDCIPSNVFLIDHI